MENSSYMVMNYEINKFDTGCDFIDKNIKLIADILWQCM